MKIALFTTLLCSFLTLSANTDIRYFDVMLFGKKVGSMTMTRTIKGDTVKYVLAGRSTARILWMDYDDISHYEVHYLGNKLLYCKYKEDMNGKLKHFTELTYNGTEYKAVTKSGPKKFVPEPYPSLLSLYYKEPIGAKKIMFEAQLMATSITSKQPGHYVFKNNDGDENEYVYNNGELAELIFHTPLATVKMKRVK